MQYAGIDLATLKRLIRQSGLSARELSLRLDRGQGYIGDLLNGRKNPETVEVGPMHQLAVILNSTDFLGLQLEDEPKSVWECCPARWSLFSVPEAATAESWLTYTRCAYTYFFPRPMREWFQRFAYRKLGWGEEAIDEYTRGTQAFSDSHLDYHRKAKSVHRLLVQESIFRNAAIKVRALSSRTYFPSTFAYVPAVRG